MDLNEYHLDHRCDVCGCRAGEHKGGTDENGPEGRCPTTRGYGHPGHGPWHSADDETWRRYWNTKTMFTPRR